MKHVSDYLYCTNCGNMFSIQCEHCFTNSIELNTGQCSMYPYKEDICGRFLLFETRIDFTSHEYNCPINRTTVYIVLLHRTGFKSRFAYFVKYWDFSEFLLFACEHLPPGILEFTHTEYLLVQRNMVEDIASLFDSKYVNEVDPKIVCRIIKRNVL